MRALFIGLASLLFATCAFASEQPNGAEPKVLDPAASVENLAVPESGTEKNCQAQDADVLADLLAWEPSLIIDPEKALASGGSCTPACRYACSATRQACLAGCGGNFQCIIGCNCDQYFCNEACGCDQDPPPGLC